MIQGTSSHVGKSIISAALCRILKQEGYSVAPFKAQNMALNSYVTNEGGEMGRAQVVQAHAAGIEPHVLMNPVLLKPTGQAKSQIIMMGKPVGTLDAKDYHYKYVDIAWPVVKQALTELLERYEVIVIEGAGSPVEVNLKSKDIVNMRVACEIQAPVLLVTDIDRGGSLASIVGTLALLEEEERKLIKGIIFNKFRGDLDIFTPAVKFIEDKTGIPVLGVVPHFKEFKIPDEDSVSNDEYLNEVATENQLDIAIMRFPHISNFTDFDVLENDNDINIRYVRKASDFGSPDVVILPGTKNTIEDLLFLHNSGLREKITSHVTLGKPIIGICGGYQMLGKSIYDPQGMESNMTHVEGLGILETVTTFQPHKTTILVEGEVIADHGLFAGLKGTVVQGYEIHMGTTEKISRDLITLTKRLGEQCNSVDGCINAEGTIWGTYLHGIFDNDDFRNKLFDNIRKISNKEQVAPKNFSDSYQQSLNLLAEHVRAALDMPKLHQIIFSNAKENVM
jgi:adenosylcobyric acid synthase